MSDALTSRRKSFLTPNALVCFEWLLLSALAIHTIYRCILPACARLNQDFPNYYLSSKLYRDGYPLARIYSMDWFERQKDHAGLSSSVVRYVPLSPFSAFVLAPFAALSPLAAKRWWVGIELIMLGATIALLRRMSNIPTRRVALVALLTMAPLQNELLFGQQHLVILFLLTVAGYLLIRGHGFGSGVAVAIAAVLKLYPALFVLVYAVRRERRALLAFCVTMLVLFAVGVTCLGHEVFRVYATEVLPRALAGQGNDPYYAGFNSPAVLLRRLFVREPDLNPAPLVDSPAAYALLESAICAGLFLSSLWFMPLGRSNDRRTVRLDWGGLVVLSLVSSKSSSTYHFCVLLLATVLGADYLQSCGRPRRAFALVVVHALVCAPLYRYVPASPSGWHVFFAVPRLYALLAYWAVFVHTCAHAARRPRRRAEAFVYAIAGLVLFIFGVRSSFRLGRERGGGGAPTVAGGPFAGAPVVTPNRFYYERLQGDRFVVASSTRDIAVTGQPSESDVFCPTVSSRTQIGWVEVAGRTSSIARFLPNRGASGAVELPFDVVNGEDPRVSADGRWLAFLREERGHAGLWLVDRGPAATRALPGAEPRQILDARHDVLDFAFFPDDRIVVAAANAPDRMLMVADPGSQDFVVLRGAEPGARYPAVSLDGHWLAYSANDRGSWQLRVLDLLTGRRRRMTDGECNSVSPAWTPDSKAILFASDCGRDLGDTSIRKLAM